MEAGYNHSYGERAAPKPARALTKFIARPPLVRGEGKVRNVASERRGGEVQAQLVPGCFRRQDDPPAFPSASWRSGPVPSSAKVPGSHAVYVSQPHAVAVPHREVLRLHSPSRGSQGLWAPGSEEGSRIGMIVSGPFPSDSVSDQAVEAGNEETRTFKAQDRPGVRLQVRPTAAVGVAI